MTRNSEMKKLLDHGSAPGSEGRHRVIQEIRGTVGTSGVPYLRRHSVYFRLVPFEDVPGT